MKLKWRKSGKYAYKRARRYEHIGRERKMNGLEITSSLYIK